LGDTRTPKLSLENGVDALKKHHITRPNVRKKEMSNVQYGFSEAVEIHFLSLKSLTVREAEAVKLQ